MKERIRNVGRILIIIIAILLYIQGMQAFRYLKRGEKVNICYEENPAQYTGDYAYEIFCDNEEREEQLNFIYWGNQGVQEITGVDLQRSTSCYILAVCGNSKILYPNVTALMPSDTNSCLISKDVAISLFGSSEGVGLSISCNGKEYLVAGIIEDSEKQFVYETKAATTTGLNHVTINNEQAGHLMEPYQLFQMRYGQGASYGYELLAGMLDVLLLFLPLIWIIILEQKCYVNYKRFVNRGERNIKAYTYLLSGILMIAVVVIFISKNTTFSLAMFPAKWSDFEAWKGIFESCKRELLYLLCTQKEQFMLPYWRCFGKGVVCGIGANIIFGIGVLRKNFACSIGKIVVK